MTYTILVALPIIFVLVLLVHTITRSIGRVWLDHRVKLALLEKLEKNPNLVTSFDDLQDLLDSTDNPEQAGQRQDILVTGVILAVCGAACALYFGNLGRGQTAVGAYIGGVACVVLGFLLTLVGLVTRYLSRPPSERGNPLSRLRQRIFGGSENELP